ncbi:thioesterase II family protein [Gloeocapsa sp. PCC 73106]|uniref:thioesterase II family protein n=1 Tax=Gloeocapsa sp. PCC 73106 TaxID=102232 RepID=UPI0002AC7D06|nr:thioesterase II family protein [Gloeocapsa sp. PCC 73106]ELR97044.1 putative thioesterase involved in non-ribosomal peptide biosynthesis [Gloeocapsa sp. PCC 73106]
MTRLNKSSSWLTFPKTNPKAQLRLFCFPYAGGSGWVFRPWLNHLPEAIELCLIELPARGKRWNESPIVRLESLLEALKGAILPHLDLPFAFFGHSMGGLVSFELTRLLATEHQISPVYLLVSGCRAPQIRDRNPPIHHLPDTEFIQELCRLNGTPQAVLEDTELMQLVLPALRSDFEILETYNYSADTPLNCPIAVFGGLQDEKVPQEDLQAWKFQTNQTFYLEMFEGDHFFIDSVRSRLLTSITKILV